jgi:hypothetical protein
MAWQTHEDTSRFNHDPREPDLETLVYWVQRLEPLIRADNEEEVIVVFCNRAGAEGEATYTGTSAVIGIKRGEVFVYGVLGRGVSELLVVDTDQPPMSKLTDADAVEGGEYPAEQPALSLDTNMDNRQPPGVSRNILSEEDQRCRSHPADFKPEPTPVSPRSPTSPRLPWLAQASQPDEPPTDARSPTRLQIPSDTRSPTRLQIPTQPQFNEYMAIDSAIADDIIIDTPALPDGPGFARRPFRPKQAVPGSPWRFPGKASPYPWHHHDGSRSAVFGGGAAMTPITPFDEDGWSSTPIDPKAPAPWFWRHEPTLSALKESIVEEEEPSEPAEIQPLPSIAEDKREPSSAEAASLDEEDEQHRGREEELREEDTEPAPLNTDWADLADVLEGLKELKARPGSAFDFRSSREEYRPSSTKSRNLSRNSSPFRLFQSSELDYGGEWDDSPASGALGLDPYRPASPMTAWEEHSSRGDSPQAFARPSSRAGHRLIHRSCSFDGPVGKHHGERTDQRQPSRLRHAVFFPAEEEDENEDEADAELDYDSEREYHHQNRNAHNHRSVSRGRQRETSPERYPSTTQELGRHPPNQWDYQEDEETDSPVSEHPYNNTPPFSTAQQQQPRASKLSPQPNTDTDPNPVNMAAAASSPASRPRQDKTQTHTHHPSPLSMDAIITTTTTTTTTTPSLCSTTSPTSAPSVITVDDDNNHSPVVVASTSTNLGLAAEKPPPPPLAFFGDSPPAGRGYSQQQQREVAGLSAMSGLVVEKEGPGGWTGGGGVWGGLEVDLDLDLDLDLDGEAWRLLRAGGRRSL